METKTSLIEIVAGPPLAPLVGAKTGLVLINNSLDEVAAPISVAEDCRRAWKDLPALDGHGAQSLGAAKVIHGRLLPEFAKIRSAAGKVLDMLVPPWPPEAAISYVEAVGMLGVLFGALSKRKAEGNDENARALLLACADMFNNESEAIGRATGLWRPVSGHRAVLAIAIKTLFATKVFAPAPSEVRRAMHDVQDRLDKLLFWPEQLLALIKRADRVVFENDQAAWDEVYARLQDSAVPGAMLWDLRRERATARFAALGAFTDKSIATEQRAQLTKPDDGGDDA